ncbi:hypothetical protein K4T52_10895 [Staphylococcus epidermidis]|nr:hypothetical protein [Staphylococcus epidermidis]MCG1317493.1 hypothetical protein [Staphylococcus epidermidis]MCG1469016.1 hypothetical protein [Staphylococcus epidermidis]
MNKLSNKEALRMTSLLKSSFRFVRHETNYLKNDMSISPQEKYQKLERLEQECVEKTLSHTDIDKEFILNLHDLLISYKSGSYDRNSAYRNFLSKYVDGNIENLIAFINSNLLPEYEYSITHPKYIINLEMGSE